MDDARKVFDRLDEFEKTGEPHGWLQWKGTNACMDVHCSCGYLGHVDADFAYFVQCPCGKVYAVSGVVRLMELTPAEANAVRHDGRPIISADAGDYEPPERESAEAPQEVN